MATARRRKTTRAAARRSGARRRSGAKARAGERRGDGRMTAIDLVEEQHEQARRTFAEIGDSSGGETRQLFAKLADMLAVHATLEERLLYPEAVRAGLRDAALDAAEEHLVQKRLLADMLRDDLGDAVFAAKCHVLEAEVLRHVEGEEAGILPELRRKLGHERLVEIGSEMRRMAEELLPREPRREVPRETGAAPELA